MKLSASEFLNYGEASLAFDSILLKSIREKRSISFVMLSCDSYEIVSGEADLTKQKKTVVNFESDKFVDSSITWLESLLLPLYANVQSFILPWHEVYTHRRDKRSVADFFLRNFHHAAVRRRNFESRLKHNGSPLATASNELAKRYIWILKSIYQDDIFSHKRLISLLTLNRYVETVEFKTPVLAKSAASIRALRGSQGAPAENTFNTLRNRVLELLP